MSDQIWLQALTPVPVSTLAVLGDIAPPGTFIRTGGSVLRNQKVVNILEFVIPNVSENSDQTASDLKQDERV